MVRSLDEVERSFPVPRFLRIPSTEMLPQHSFPGMPIPGDEALLRLFAAALRHTSDALIVTEAEPLDDPGPRIIYVNEAFQQQTGYSPEEAIGRSPRFLQGPRTARLVLDQIRIHLAAKRQIQCELINYRKDGSPFWVELDIIPLNGESGQVEFLLSVQRDVTGRRALEERVHENGRLEAIGRMAGGIAHDFNNLLTVINGYAAMILSGIDAGMPVNEQVRQIQLAGERAATLTHRLLAFSRKQVVKRGAVNLNRLVEGMSEMLRRLIGEDISFAFHPDAGAPSVLADAGLLEQVVMNLAANARDAMPNGGKIEIRTGFAHRGAASGVHDAGRFGTLTVTDNGSGIRDEHRKHLFEPYFSTKEPGRGTGLGLSMALGTVTQFGGFIEVESEVDRGSSFRLFLPLSEEAATVERAAPAKRPKEGLGETVALVEDDEAVRVYTRELLVRHGYRVLDFGHPEAAVASLPAETPPDLLITDVIMPGMNGRQLAERLMARFPGLRVLYISGYTDNVIQHRGWLEAGLEFLSKPFTPQILIERVRSILDRPARSAQAAQP